jgi:hypothetical protein
LRINASKGDTINAGPAPALAQQSGRDEVDGRLAPSGALDAEHARAVLDEVADRLELVGAEGRVGAGEVGEERRGAVFEGHGGPSHRD